MAGDRQTGFPPGSRNPGLLVFLTAAVLASNAAASAQLIGARRAKVSEAEIRSHMEMLASDALNGRASGSRDEWIAATYVASQLRRFGLEPFGDHGTYIQTIETPARPARGRGATSPQGGAGTSTEPQPGRTWNVVARLAGSDRERASEVILIGAHLDHVAPRGTGDDTIFNGADDNASGVTAVLELARIFASGSRPKRSMIFAWFGSEETGGFGVRHFVEHPPVPLGSIVADLQFEMIGRPDPAVPARTLWLSGYERSTLGPELARRGARIVADPHLEQQFFLRSDNIYFAYRGVVAHTLSSYGLHRDYHTPADEISRIDFPHMVAVIQSMVEPVAWLAGSTYRPAWRPGQSPERP